MKTILILLVIALVAIPSVALAGKPTSNPGKGHTPVTICHHAGPTKTITITVDDDAVPHHIANHGDTIGPCPTTPPDDNGGGGTGTTPTPTVTEPTPTTPVETPTVVEPTPTVTEPTPTTTTPDTVTPPVKKPTKKPTKTIVAPKAVSGHKQPAATPAPQTHQQLAKQAGGEALPYTGLPVGVVLALGLSLLGAGVAARRYLATQ